jgi:peroxiredoxin
VALARALRRRSERVGLGQSNTAQAADLAREAESLYVAAIANHGRMRLGRENLEKIAEVELFELRHLGIGHEAPEIDGLDLEGRPMALSDFRGKVVVLEFWGQWCSVSQETASHERSLAESMRGKPVILLGVNSDSPEMAAADGHRRICERSWRDGGEVNGGPIAHRWNVRALPTTYIIDDRGIIRYKIGPRPDGHDNVLEILDPTGKARDKWQLRTEEIAAVVNGLIAEIDRRPDPVPAPSTKSGTP